MSEIRDDLVIVLRAARDWLALDHPVPGWIIIGAGASVVALCFKAIARLTT